MSYDRFPNMPVREWLAAQALHCLQHDPANDTVEATASRAFRIADAMMAESQKRAMRKIAAKTK